MNPKRNKITLEQKEQAERQILKNQKTVSYITREYPIETIVSKYAKGLGSDENELFVPDYQRGFTWTESRQSKFIESVLMGLPIPFIFVADLQKDARLEIVDGSQRIRTLHAFMADGLELCDLEKLTALNGFKFSDLSLPRQRRFSRHTIRMIELTERTDEEVRRDLFERINTGSDQLKEMEIRWGVKDSPVLYFVRECADLELFQQLAPISQASAKRKGRDELVLRFFAYLENYEQFGRRVTDFLNDYLEEIEDEFDENLRRKMRKEFKRMLRFVEKHFPHGFRKGQSYTTTPRVRFEAISVGVALALREEPKLQPKDVSKWLDSKAFRQLTTSDGANSRTKIVKRIEFVRDKLLEK